MKNFFFTSALLLLSIFFYDRNVYAACDYETGQIVSCGQALGNNAFEEHFGIEQTLVDPEDENSGLTPIEPTLYDNPLQIFIISNSNLRTHHIRFLRDVEITIADGSKLYLQLNENTKNITVRGNGQSDGTVSAEKVYYLGGGNTGRFEAILGWPSIYFFSLDNINFVDLRPAEGALRGGVFSAGFYDNSENMSAEIIVDTLIGNGALEIVADSLLTINNYTIDGCDTIENCEIQLGQGLRSIKGNGNIIFNTEIYTEELSVLQATLNKYSKIDMIYADSNGFYTFNANATLGNVEFLNKLQLKNNAFLTVDKLNKMNHVLLDRGTTLSMITGVDNTGGNSLEKVEGEGTLHINPEKREENQVEAVFYISDIDLSNLIMDSGSLIISNTTDTYNNQEEATEAEEDQEIIEITRKIKNIDQSLGSEGGTITVNGTVIFDKITNLKKLIVCGEAQLNCDKYAKLTLSQVNNLGTLDMTNGNLFIEITERNQGVSADNIFITGGKIISVIKDTTDISSTKTYQILHSDNLQINVDTSNFSSNLPDWYSYQYRLSDNNNELLIDIDRLSAYSQMIMSSSYASDEELLEFSSYIDNLISNQIQLGITSQTLTYIDLFSNNDIDTLASNIKSLLPKGNELYLQNSHITSTQILDMARQMGINSTKPYGMWDRRKAPSADSENIWVSTFIASGEIEDNKGFINDYNNSLLQIGYKGYSWSSKDNKREIGYYFYGGVGKGEIKDDNSFSSANSIGLGLTRDSRNENFITKTSLLYTYISYDADRDYFLSLANTQDYPEVDRSRLQSSLSTHEFMVDIMFTKEIFLEYARHFSSWDNTILKPKIYVTPSLFVSEEYAEVGPISSMDLSYYVTTIFDSGIGFDLSKEISAGKNSSIMLFLSSDALFRYYYLPSNKIGFSDVNEKGLSIDGNSVTDMLTSMEFGALFKYKKGDMVISYTSEQGKDYNYGAVKASYKYKLR